MIQLNPILLLLLGELLLVTTVVSVVLITVFITKKRNDRTAVDKLISRIKEDEAQRKEETRKIIEEKYGLQDEKLEDLLSRIGREEKRFYQTLINLYLKRDATALGTLNVTFEGATDPYRSIELPVTAVSEDLDKDVSKDEAVSAEQREAEIEHLLNEKRQLSEELKTTMESMGKMLKEYATMYGGGSGPPDPQQMAALFMAKEEGEQEEDTSISEQDEPVTVESSETSGDEAPVAVVARMDAGTSSNAGAVAGAYMDVGTSSNAGAVAGEEPVRRDVDQDDIDSLIDDVALQSDKKAEVVEESSDDHMPVQENIDPDPASEDDDWDDLEVLPEDDALLDLDSDGKKE